jgi:hypothetical protein
MPLFEPKNRQLGAEVAPPLCVCMHVRVSWYHSYWCVVSSATGTYSLRPISTARGASRIHKLQHDKLQPTTEIKHAVSLQSSKAATTCTGLEQHELQLMYIALH